MKYRDLKNGMVFGLGVGERMWLWVSNRYEVKLDRGGVAYNQSGNLHLYCDYPKIYRLLPEELT